ncbi:hypothetical protein QBC33DRAFT_563455 [Phialemonium atrogriseum]|uniref:Uncharacterized protein n=1 Tax=Phialemonium atrogriseum TaxID=1093897 RepID=A0AAJ0FI30_9PEZI|nr:uncharacterized protein QBC33DRAFT_563455 [Phialemonium atrogriseum]KAK1762854.1 hypothetical protein QBC33DRAFT_563455 [Phialemonium atrogriseum]
MDKLPKAHLAIIGDDHGRLKLLDQIEIPDLEDDMVLVQTRAVAFSPVDVKMSCLLASAGARTRSLWEGTDVGVVRTPDHMSFEEASTLGTGTGTVRLALFQNLQIPGWPARPAMEPKKALA